MPIVSRLFHFHKSAKLHFYLSITHALFKSIFKPFTIFYLEILIFSKFTYGRRCTISVTNYTQEEGVGILNLVKTKFDNRFSGMNTPSQIYCMK